MAESTAQVPSSRSVEADDAEPIHTAEEQSEALVEEEMLVEDVSIDGMCGVY